MLFFTLALALGACLATPPLFDMVPLGEMETPSSSTMVAPLKVDTEISKGSSTHEEMSSLMTFPLSLRLHILSCVALF